MQLFAFGEGRYRSYCGHRPGLSFSIRTLLFADPDYPQLQPNVLYVAGLDRIFRSGTTVRCSATASSCWRSHMCPRLTNRR